jgi:hypothetical protein
VGLNLEEGEAWVWLDIRAPPLRHKLKEFKEELRYTIYMLPSGQAIISAAGSVDCYFVNREGAVKALALDEPAYFITELEDRQTFAISCANVVKLCREDGQVRAICEKMGSYYRGLEQQDRLFYTLGASQVTAWHLKDKDCVVASMHRAEGHNFSRMWVSGGLIVALDKDSSRLVAWDPKDPRPVLTYARELTRVKRILALPKGRLCLLKTVEGVVSG